MSTGGTSPNISESNRGGVCTFAEEDKERERERGKCKNPLENSEIGWMRKKRKGQWRKKKRKEKKTKKLEQYS